MVKLAPLSSASTFLTPYKNPIATNDGSVSTSPRADYPILAKEAYVFDRAKQSMPAPYRQQDLNGVPMKQHLNSIGNGFLGGSSFADS